MHHDRFPPQLLLVKVVDAFLGHHLGMSRTRNSSFLYALSVRISLRNEK